MRGNDRKVKTMHGRPQTHMQLACFIMGVDSRWTLWSEILDDSVGIEGYTHRSKP